MEAPKDNYFDIKEKIASRASLLVVSKGQIIDKIKLIIEAGHKLFGENRVQEAKEKWVGLKKTYPDIKLHMIGKLQRNKVQEAVKIFDAIESLDSKRLADEIYKHAPKMVCFVQVNIGEEPQKSGAMPQDVKELVEYAKGLGLEIRGLMCIPPNGGEKIKFFEMMKELASLCNLKELSMGMSSDWYEAIEHGSTEVRVGTSIFGKHPTL